jgi:hypothetical protein
VPVNSQPFLVHSDIPCQSISCRKGITCLHFFSAQFHLALFLSIKCQHFLLVHSVPRNYTSNGITCLHFYLQKMSFRGVSCSHFLVCQVSTLPSTVVVHSAELHFLFRKKPAEQDKSMSILCHQSRIGSSSFTFTLLTERH